MSAAQLPTGAAPQASLQIAEEQAALRRVATLVARGAAPEEVFAAVTEEVRVLLGADLMAMRRYDPDGMAVNVGWSARDEPSGAGLRTPLGGRNVATIVYETGRPARIDDYSDAWGPSTDVAMKWGIRSSVGAPIIVEGRVWGLMLASSTREELFPADAEARLTGFTELVGIAIANAQSRMEVRAYADEQAALRRVAMLVAAATPPAEVFATVAGEAGKLLGCDFTVLNRYDPDEAVTVVGAWSRDGLPVPAPVGSRLRLGGQNASTRVFRTARPTRINRYGPDAGLEPGPFAIACIRASVGAPIIVGGQLWGVMLVITQDEPLPADTEGRLTGFTELAATAIANAEVQAALTTSRQRLVTAADTTRRRIERDLHDGVQQHLVTVALQVRAAQAAAPPGSGELAQQLREAVAGLTSALDELREIARGIHPAILAERGLRPALISLARRSPVRVRLDARVDARLPELVETAAYYVTAEALTNAAKHARASVVDVQARLAGGMLRVRIQDDGCGGAAPGRGSGLIGLTDRAEALGGRLTVHSPPGKGTAILIELPLGEPTPPEDGP